MTPLALISVLLGAQFPKNLIDEQIPLALRGSADQISGESKPGLIRFSVLKKGDTPYACEVQTARTLIPVKANDTLYFTYEARAISVQNESQTGLWSLRVQRPVDPYDGPYSSSSTVGKTWRRFHGSFRADKDYAAGQLLITFHVASAVQTLEIRGLKFTNHGPSVDPKSFPSNAVTYAGQESNAPWRKTAAAMIEKNRKAELVIQTKPNAMVHVKMLRHAYPFATVTGVDPSRTDADAVKFFDFMKANYSRLTAPIYWSDWGWESPAQKQKYVENLDWCFKNGWRVKGHNLIWPSYKWSPARVKGLSDSDLSKEITTALDQRIEALKKYPFETVDVVNELVSEHDFEDKLGLGFAVDAFKKAHAAWPKADLVYNDYLVQDGDGVNPKYLGYAKKLKAMGAPLNLLGYQAHFGESLPSITWLWKLLETADKEVGLPVEITEFDMDTRDDKAQGEFTRDLLTAWFAHPQSKGFTMWGFWEGDHWIPSSAMVRKDWSMRPSAVAYHQLVTKTWWTDVTVKADAKGIARVRGFRGDYQISTGHKARPITLSGPGTRVSL